MTDKTVRDYPRMYRPTNTETFVGNLDTIEKAKSMLKAKRVPKTLLFYGDSGCGKTTLARIVAKALICLEPTEDGLPCEQCRNCLGVNNKLAIDGKTTGLNIVEVDVGQENKKDDMIELIRDMRAKPIGKQNKVFILDEVHELTSKSQTAILKVLEEPDPWLYIFLCTTNPGKLLDTIRNRVTEMRIGKPTLTELRERIIQVCQSERIKYQKEAIDAMIKHARMSPRQALVNLQELTVDDKIVTLEKVQQILQIKSIEDYVEYFNTYQKDMYYALDFIDRIEEKSTKYADFIGGLADFIVDLINVRTNVSRDKFTKNEIVAMQKILDKMSIDDLIIALKRIGEAIKLRDNPRYALTVFTLQMAFPDMFDQKLSREDNERAIKLEEIESKENYVKVTEGIENEEETEDEIVTEENIMEIFNWAAVVKEETA